MDKLFEKKEAADYLRISVESLGRLLSSGKIRYARVTPGSRGKIVIPESAIEEFLEKQTNKAEYEKEAIRKTKSWHFT